MSAPVAHVAITDPGLAVRSGAGVATLPFAAVEAVWMRRDRRLLVTGSNPFNMLPVGRRPPEDIPG